MTSKNMQPVLWGGLFIGVLSALPVIKLGNCVCCMWVIGGGIVAAYLLQKESSVALTVGDGAFAGFLAGLVGAVVAAVLSAFFSLILGPVEMEVMRRVAQENPDMPPWLRDAMANRGAGLFLGLQFVGFLIALCVYSIFATIGGMIGAALFKGGKPAVLPAEPPPPIPPPQG